jgi:hypothetical protein
VGGASSSCLDPAHVRTFTNIYTTCGFCHRMCHSVSSEEMLGSSDCDLEKLQFYDQALNIAYVRLRMLTSSSYNSYPPDLAVVMTPWPIDLNQRVKALSVSGLSNVCGSSSLASLPRRRRDRPSCHVSGLASEASGYAAIRNVDSFDLPASSF